MKFVVNSSEMQKIDEYSIEVCKIPALDLMEQAAMEVVAVMKNRITKDDRILAVCGPGNNGGDGVAAGRILYLQGYHVAILFIGEEEKASVSMKIQLEMAKKIGVPLENSNKLCEYNIIIDALFGVGLSRNITSRFEAIIQEINRKDNLVYAVDIPSGISADDGKVMNAAIKADHTITFGKQKLGLLFYPGVEYAGNITVVDIGFPSEATEKANLHTFYYEPEDLRWMPRRKAYSNKGTYGKVLIIAGCKGMSGAAYLSAKAAYRTGAGLVKLLTSEANRVIIQTSLPEALFAAYDEVGLTSQERNKLILEALNWATVVVIGPGIGKSNIAAELVDTVIKEAKVPVIIDADAITLLAKQLDQLFSYTKKENNIVTKTEKIKETETTNKIELLSEAKMFEENELITKTEIINEMDTIKERVKCLDSIITDQVILTPHLMELSRLLGKPVSVIANNLIDTAHQCSYNSKLIYAIKDARTIVAQDKNTYVNVSGNNGMATGGSGDVLTGIIAALIAQGMENFDATCLAVYIHGLAGDVAADEKGFYSLMASDIVNSIEKVIRGKG